MTDGGAVLVACVAVALSAVVFGLGVGLTVSGVVG